MTTKIMCTSVIFICVMIGVVCASIMSFGDKRDRLRARAGLLMCSIVTLIMLVIVAIGV